MYTSNITETVVNVKKEVLQNYVNNGWYIFPVYGVYLNGDGSYHCACGEENDAIVNGYKHTPGKHPKTLNGNKNAKNEIFALDEFTNVAIDCEQSKLVVLDFDIHKANYSGEDLRQRLDKEFPTLVHKTGSGGFHYIYTAPKDWVASNSTNGLSKKGIDIRSNGYILAPPSQHICGGVYEVINNVNPIELPIFVQELLKKTNKKTNVTTSGFRSMQQISTINTVKNKMFTSVNGEKIQTLFIDGDWQSNYPSQSEADQALCNHLAYWTNNDVDLMDTLFRQSALYRDKWEREDYRMNTINNAIQSNQSTETPQTARETTVRRIGRQDEIKQLLIENGYDFRIDVIEDEIILNNEKLSDKHYKAVQDFLYNNGYGNSQANEYAFSALATENEFHPVIDFFESLEWDGTDHVTKFLQHLSFANFEEWSKTMFHKWLLGVVTTVYESQQKGIVKFQNPMLVLSGMQGAGKSTLFQWLCPLDEDVYFMEGPLNPHDQEHQRNAVRKLIWEIGELDATTRKTDRSALKNFLTQKTFTYRLPWGKAPVTKPRMVSYAGSINPEDGFLNDPTGERRFVPVNVTKIDWNYTNIDLKQLWAQLVFQYKNGVRPELTTEEKEILIIVQQDHKVEEPLVGEIQELFEIDPTQTEWKEFSNDILAILQDKMKMRDAVIQAGGTPATRKISTALLQLGLGVSQNIRIDGKRAKGYVGIRVHSQFARPDYLNKR